MRTFIGRKEEIKLINGLLNRPQSKIITINGRRRIGKSTLAEKIAEGYNFFSFSGASPRDTETSQGQISHFLSQLSKKTGKSYGKCTDWYKALNKLSDEIPKDEKCVILFDEISWMSTGEKSFISKLKVWWDTDISKRNVLLIFCGSVSTWIEKNIIKSTAFYGRISAFINLHQLSIPESAEFLKNLNFKGSSFEFYKILSVTGGIPWYLEQIDPGLTAGENIENLCFKHGGLLKNEFETIFNDVFSKHGDIYNQILVVLCGGMKTLSEIRSSIKYSTGGRLGELMENLIICGFVSKHKQWSLKTKKVGKQGIYRICDPYIKFYLRYIKPLDNQGKLPKSFDSIIGIQMESLLIQNRETIWKILGIENVLIDNPYIQRPTSKKKGCQIDYLIQTETNNLYVCEFKFQRGTLDSDIIKEMQEKLGRLIIPRGTAAVPVLFHLGEVSLPVYQSKVFYRIVDLADLLESQS